jgi:uncharacterized protein
MNQSPASSQTARPTAGDLIRHFDLKPLPGEGGFYARTYRALETIGREAPPKGDKPHRPLATAILYLLTPETSSALHRLPTDEIFHFYLGDPVGMVNLHPHGKAEKIILGHDILAGQVVQSVVPGGVWQGGRLIQGGEYALLGTTMSPGFDWPDLELGDAERLAREYPDLKKEILALAPQADGREALV